MRKLLLFDIIIKVLGLVLGYKLIFFTIGTIFQMLRFIDEFSSVWTTILAAAFIIIVGAWVVWFVVFRSYTIAKFVCRDADETVQIQTLDRRTVIELVFLTLGTLNILATVPEILQWIYFNLQQSTDSAILEIFKDKAHERFIGYSLIRFFCGVILLSSSRHFAFLVDRKSQLVMKDEAGDE